MIQTALAFIGAESGVSVAGVDEVGRGALAGPVLAAAVVLDPEQPIDGINDSKQLSALMRTRIAAEVRCRATAWSVGRAEVEEIDRLNILQATMLAMQRAIAALAVIPDLALIDGNRCPKLLIPSRAVIHGDTQIDAIAAASILAKVDRDREMVEMEKQYPGYGFARHKGYATAIHREALRRLGRCPIHRRHFALVQQATAMAT